MSTYTLTAPEFTFEALEVGLEKIATAAKELSLATKTVIMIVGGPLVGLAFVVTLPVIGFALVAYYSTKLIAVRWAKITRHTRTSRSFSRPRSSDWPTCLPSRSLALARWSTSG